MLQSMDRTVFFFINHGLSNLFFDLVMPVISGISDGPILFAVSFMLLFSKKRDLRLLGLIMLAGLTVSFYAVSGIKALVARYRSRRSRKRASLCAGA